MSNEMNLTDVYRLGTLNRWQIVDTARPQSVAEHSFHVACIAWSLLKELGMGDDKDTLLQILALAITHDMAEAITGDLPTPIKKIMDTKKLQEVENSLGGFMEDTNWLVDNPTAQFLVKLADLIEAEHFLKLYGRGDHADKIKMNMAQRLALKISERQSSGLSRAVTKVKKSLNEDPLYLENILGIF